ncbi:conjugative transposon protein TraJ [Mucilaginibacter myungsuensis]|uniref:Conjugative transposon protein TraJ n=1 Tax=Mucilaginibacter myungsuensis TaxID=649104 RepID=A0A929PXF2_9SPHI|nr:conjugative transposon protein TraJ [Mucilaginibacter myungsuensis]MBE9663111.1 conjugative transposon protein TraJ [Mucilaginibacter myungsuensis]MDN3598746.1 conjugative transposon protein TraJ [Mucilaginibacter myungsuensis]
MKKKIFFSVFLTLTGIGIPLLSRADGLADDIHELQSVLDSVYNEMLPLCSDLIGVARAIAGFGALWYIAARVWRHLASAEPIDFYPLMRPFGLGLAILLFPTVIAVINGVMNPVVKTTAGMVKNSDAAIAKLLAQKQAAIEKTDTWQMYVGDDGDGDRDKWYKYTHPEDKDGSNDKLLKGLGNDVKFAMDKAGYKFRNSVKQWMSEVLQVVYEAAALCINTIRTFYLVVLAILGPLVFGLSVFDGLQHVLTTWLAKYLNVFLWLPVANIFGTIIGKVQENMLKLDIQQVNNAGDTFFSSTDTAYLIFLLIGIVGYFTVPAVAGYIINPGGSNGLLNKVTNLTHIGLSSASSMSTTAGANAGERMASGATNIINTPSYIREGYRSAGNDHQAEKLNGNAKN